MPQYDVRWVDGAAVLRRRVEAPDAHALAAVLGVAPEHILAANPTRRADAAPVRRWGQRFPLRRFSKELSILLGAGIALLDALTTLRDKDAGAASAAALDDVIERLNAGASFSVALGTRPDAFDSLFIAVVASAERTGQLREALASHAEYLAWTESLRDRLVSACVYPLLLVAAGLAVSLFLLVYVVPRFAGLLDGVGGDMPAASRALLALGTWMGAHPIGGVLVALCLLSMPVWIWRQPALRERLLAWVAVTPGLAPRLRMVALARLYRTLGMLLRAGIPIAAALAIARDVVSVHMRAALDAATSAVTRGQRLTDALAAADLATPVALRMVRVGERSGSVGPMLSEAASFYDEELARLTELVSRLLNPLLMLLMGLLIGTIVVLMYLPIFQLMEQVQ